MEALASSIAKVSSGVRTAQQVVTKRSCINFNPVGEPFDAKNLDHDRT
jgi:hypothetical protein